MSDSFLVHGLAGKKTLKGQIAVSGAKNAILQSLAISVLFRDKVSYSRVPKIEDASRMLEILSDLGAETFRTDGGAFVGFANEPKTELPVELAKKLRGSVILTGPILARCGKVVFPHPGGCVIGKRPIDIFLDGYKKMGAEVREEDSLFYVSSRGDGKLKGAKIFLRVPSVTATQTFMMAAVLAEGETVIMNAALEPETKYLADFLNSCGAKITGVGTSTIKIQGADLLSANGKTCEIPPDRIETATFAVLGALCAEDLLVTDCNPEEAYAVLEYLKSAGVQIEIGEKSVRIKNSVDAKPFKALDIKTHEYPGFPTDAQSVMTVFLTQAEGEALVFETIYEGRLGYTEGLVRMGASVKMWDSNRVSIKGPTKLHGKELESPDLRAGLAYVIAGLVAEGDTIIHNAYFVDRGYERIEERLRGIGANISRQA